MVWPFKRKPYEGPTALSDAVELLRTLPDSTTVYYVMTCPAAGKYPDHPALGPCIRSSIDVSFGGVSSLNLDPARPQTFDGKSRAADLVDLLLRIDDDYRRKGIAYAPKLFRWSTDPSDGGMVGQAEALDAFARRNGLRRSGAP